MINIPEVKIRLGGSIWLGGNLYDVHSACRFPIESML